MPDPDEDLERGSPDPNQLTRRLDHLSAHGVVALRDVDASGCWGKGQEGALETEIDSDEELRLAKAAADREITNNKLDPDYHEATALIKTIEEIAQDFGLRFAFFGAVKVFLILALISGDTSFIVFVILHLRIPLWLGFLIIAVFNLVAGMVFLIIATKYKSWEEKKKRREMAKDALAMKQASEEVRTTIGMARRVHHRRGGTFGSLGQNMELAQAAAVLRPSLEKALPASVQPLVNTVLRNIAKIGQGMANRQAPAPGSFGATFGSGGGGGGEAGGGGGAAALLAPLQMMGNMRRRLGSAAQVPDRRPSNRTLKDRVMAKVMSERAKRKNRTRFATPATRMTSRQREVFNHSASKRSPSGDASGSESSGSGSGSGSVRIRSGPCAAGGGILATISSGHASSHDRALQQAVQMNGSVKMSEIPTSREGSPAPRPRHSSAIPPDDLHPVLSSSRTGVSREGFRSPKATLLADADDADIEEGGEDTYG